MKTFLSTRFAVTFAFYYDNVAPFLAASCEPNGRCR